jgi:hypothetical protein
MIPASSTEESIENPQEHEGPVEVLMRLTATAGLLRSTDGRCYAKVKVGDRREIYPLKSAAFRRWLTGRYYRDRQITPSDWAIRRVLGTLEANAWLEGDAQSIFIRVGHDGGNNGNGLASYLDLADPGGQAIEIGPGGWSVVNEPRAHFRRPVGQLPLPTPSRDGSIELLRPYVNLTDRLCLLATGGAFEGHTSFTNDEESAVQVQRPVILTGIEEFVERGDLSDRAVRVNLPPIALGQRRLDGEFWDAFKPLQRAAPPRTSAPRP